MSMNGVVAQVREAYGDRLNDSHRTHFADCWRSHWPCALARLTDEIERLSRWVSDLQSGMYINCVYCGHRYGPRETTPASMAEVLKAHVEECPQHPMSALRAEREAAIELLTVARALLPDPDFEPNEDREVVLRAIRYRIDRYLEKRPCPHHWARSIEGNEELCLLGCGTRRPLKANAK